MKMQYPGLSVKQHAEEILGSLDTAVPYGTTFLFMEEGCGAVGQGTPLARAIELAMKKHFQIWEQTWVRPHLEDLAGLEPGESITRYEATPAQEASR